MQGKFAKMTDVKWQVIEDLKVADKREINTVADNRRIKGVSHFFVFFFGRKQIENSKGCQKTCMIN